NQQACAMFNEPYARLRLPLRGCFAPAIEPVHAQTSARTLQPVGEKQLAAQIVAQHPILPKGLHGIGPERESGEETGGSGTRIGRRGIVSGPAAVFDKGFYPAVGVGSADHVELRNRIESTALETIDDTRGNTDGAQHYGHGRGKVFTMSLFTLEQE